MTERKVLSAITGCCRHTGKILEFWFQIGGSIGVFHAGRICDGRDQDLPSYECQEKIIMKKP